MRKLLAIIALCTLWVLCCLTNGASAFPFPHGGAVQSYTGPCSVVLTHPCGEGYNVARSVTSSYSGPLFQVYNGTTTTDIGQTVQHAADMAALFTACANQPICVYSKVYAQIGGSLNDLRPYLTSDGGNGSINCATTYDCAPPVMIDPANGLPVIVTPFPTALYNSTTGETWGGGNPTSVFSYASMASWSDCCGFFGIAHASSAPDTQGTDFLQGLTYGNGHTYSNCSTSTANCANLDIEIKMNDGADVTFSLTQGNYMTTTAGGAGVINTYWNSSTPIYSATPVSGTTLNIGKYPRVGGGGDMSHVNSIVQEGLIANASWTATDYANLSSNVSAFYGSHSRDACSGSADLDYSFNTNGGGQTANSNNGPLSALLGYSLRRLRASYYGPIADLRDSTGTVHTYGPSSSGCGIDPAAATFCAANAPCTVKKIYNQGTFNSGGIGNVHDTKQDLVQATVANQPTVDFTGLNGYPIIAFNGSQYLCTGNPQTNNLAAITAVGWVAKRSSGTSYSTVMNVGGSDQSVGFGNASGQIYGNIGNLIAGGSYTESHWHSSVNEQINNSAGGITLYGDNTSVATGNYGAWKNVGDTAPMCMGADDNAGTMQNFLTGGVAEVVVLSQDNPATGLGATERSALFTAQQSSWGTLPN
jgi:hypothetical protein